MRNEKEKVVSGQHVVCPKCKVKHVIPFGWISDTDTYCMCEECSEKETELDKQYELLQD